MTLLGSLRLPARVTFTTRGQIFLATGVSIGVGAVVLGQEGLLRVAVLLVLLPPVFALVLGRYRDRIDFTRSVSQIRAAPGVPLRVSLDLTNRTIVATTILLAEDQLSERLGTAPRFVLDRLPGGGRVRVQYTVSDTVRGCHLLGPLVLRMTDPFGLCEITRAFTTSTPVIVPPRTWPVTLPHSGRGFRGETVHGRSPLPVGQDDSTVREYRNGDDVRRLHWRSTARHGQLMVRQEEPSAEPHGVLLLDSRPEAHHGSGADSSFEWAVSAVASAALALAGQRYRIQLLTGATPASDLTPTGTRTILDTFAQISWQEPGSLDRVVATLARSTHPGMVLAVLGELSPDQATALARSAPGATHRWAIVLRTREWDGHLPAADAELIRSTSTADILRARGWTVTEAHRHESVPTVWGRLLEPPSSSSPRSTEQPP